MAEVAHTSLPHSQHQVVHRRGGRDAVVLPSYHMQTTAIKAIDHTFHRSGEGPCCTSVGQGRAHGEFVQPQFRLPREAVISPYVTQPDEYSLSNVHAQPKEIIKRENITSTGVEK